MKIRDLIKNTKGVSAIIYTIALTLLMGMAAVVVDIGNVMAEDQKLQTASDAMALAAAQELPNTENAYDVAVKYAELNGFNSSDFTISFSDYNRSISVNGRKKVNYLFAKVLGFDHATANCSAVATENSMGAAFDYALFSGSQTVALSLNGSDEYVSGDVHTNKNFVANGSNLNITGACEAVGTVITNGSNMKIGERLPDSQFIDMPDFSEEIKAQAEAAGTAYAGDKIYNGSNVNVDSSIYVNGNVYVNGGNFTGKGCILATGDIIFNGSNLRASTDDSVCFYTKSGNVYVNGAKAEVYGIVYAPKGNIIFNGSNQTIYGRAIGNVVIFNGSHLQVISGANDLNSLPTHGVKLIH